VWRTRCGGAPRIHGELLKLGIEVAQSTVAKYMAKSRTGGSGQTWKTFLRNHAAGIGTANHVGAPSLVTASVLTRLCHFTVCRDALCFPGV
jgi:hypothetical protein